MPAPASLEFSSTFLGQARHMLFNLD